MDDEDNSWYEEPEDFPKRRKTWTNRTPVRGKFKISFPWFGGPVNVEWSASGRQAMLEIVAACVSFVAICYIIFVGATPENISRVGQVMARRATDGEHKPNEYRAPEKVPVQTSDGIEIIEVCVPNCDRDCGECLPCPAQIPCPSCTNKISPLPEIP